MLSHQWERPGMKGKAAVEKRIRKKGRKQRRVSPVPKFCQ
jgi:hypothetical protein